MENGKAPGGPAPAGKAPGGSKPVFPLFFDLSEKRVLFVGAGAVAARRIHSILPFVKEVTVVAPEAVPEIRALAGEGKLVLLLRRYAADDLEGRDIVFAASDDTALNDSIFSACRERGVPVNVSSDRTKCDFFFPAIAREGSVVAGICSGGDDISGVKRAAEAVRKALKKS